MKSPLGSGFNSATQASMAMPISETPMVRSLHYALERFSGRSLLSPAVGVIQRPLGGVNAVPIRSNIQQSSLLTAS